MKNISLFTLIIFLLANCRNSNTQNNTDDRVSDTIFSFVTVDYYSESSKDSHDYSTTLSLKKGVLYYDYIYTGYPDDQKEHKQMNLNDSMINTIKDKLKTLSLFQNYKKKYPLNKNMYRVETGYSLNIVTDTTKYALSVDGGIPMDINDEVHDNLSVFFSYIEGLFPKKNK